MIPTPASSTQVGASWNLEKTRIKTYALLL